MKDFLRDFDNFSLIKDIPFIPVITSTARYGRYIIAIPTYKRANDLKLAIESSLSQDFHDDYLIVIMDNNPERGDETELMITKYYGKTNRISYYKNTQNLGMINNWNRLFEVCLSEYIVMLHDDDYLFPHFLSTMDTIISSNKNVAAINSNKIRWNGSDQIKQCKPNSKIRFVKHTAYSNYGYYAFGAPTGCVFNRQIILKEGGFDNEFYPSSDYAFIMKLSIDHLVLTTVDSLMLVRYGANTPSMNETQLKWLDMDYQLKEYFGKQLKLPRFFINLILFFEMKIRLRTINEFDEGHKYKNWTKGNLLFVALFKIYRFFYKLWFFERTYSVF